MARRKPLDVAAFERMSQEQTAEMFGVTTRTLRLWERESFENPNGAGCFPRNEDGTYHFRGMFWWMKANRKFPCQR